MSTEDLPALSEDELAAEGVTALPPKEVISLLDLNADIDAALHLAAPVDLAVAANANVVAPISGAVSANVLSVGSDSAALADQHAVVDQGLSGDAVAHAPQDSTLEQGTAGTDATDPADAGAAVPAPTAPDGSGDLSSALDGDLLKIDIDANIDADAAAPVAGAVAANANVAAPIDAAVSANIGSIDSHSAALAQQDVQLTQHLDGVTAEATAAQQSDISQ